MKLTTKSEYSLLALIHIARHYDEGNFVKIEDICANYDIDKKYLEQLFCIMRQNNFITTKRGSSGGYKLSKSPHKISIAQIVRAMDGQLAPTGSVSKYYYTKTPLRQEKKITGFFREIQKLIAMKMEKSKLSDFI